MVSKSRLCAECRKRKCFVNCDKCSQCISKSKGTKGKVKATALATDEQIDALAIRAALGLPVTPDRRLRD